MTLRECVSAAKVQLAIDLNCTPDDFDKEEFIFCESKELLGRRPFPRGKRHFDMLSMGSGVIVSATADILPYIREQLLNKTRDGAFAMPFVHSTGLYFLASTLSPIPYAEGYSFSFVEKNEIPLLYTLDGFVHALNRDIRHPRPDVLVLAARYGDRIVGMAGASNDCEMLWQIGIDVEPEHRKAGLAAILTNRLAIEILNRGKIPYYGTASANIPSQRTAVRAGFIPAWCQAYRGVFDWGMTEPTG